MPGRGQPWKAGGLPDGTVKEEDIDPAYQAIIEASGGHIIEDEGVPLPQQPALNFVGAGVTATDGVGKTVVTIPGGGGSFDLANLVDPFVDFYFYDEFFYPDPTNQFPHYEKSVTSIFASNSTVGGTVQYQNSAVANQVARINICGAGMQVIDSTKKLVLRVRTTLVSAFANTVYATGFFSSQSNGPGGVYPWSNLTQFGLGFISDGGANWKAYTDDDITPVTTDTGVAVDNAIHVFEIVFDPTGTPTITFKIDGVTVHTQTTNLPSFNGAWYSNVQTDGTVSPEVQIDSLFIYNER